MCIHGAEQPRPDQAANDAGSDEQPDESSLAFQFVTEGQVAASPPGFNATELVAFATVAGSPPMAIATGKASSVPPPAMELAAPAIAAAANSVQAWARSMAVAGGCSTPRAASVRRGWQGAAA